MNIAKLLRTLFYRTSPVTASAYRIEIPFLPQLNKFTIASMTAFKNSFFQFSALFYHICSKGSYFINIHFSLFACPYYEAKISLRGFSNKKKEEIAKFISSVRGNLVEHQYLNNLN